MLITLIKTILKIEQKKKSVETKIELALRDNNFLLAQSLCEELVKKLLNYFKIFYVVLIA